VLHSSIARLRTADWMDIDDGVIDMSVMTS